MSSDVLSFLSAELGAFRSRLSAGFRKQLNDLVRTVLMGIIGQFEIKIYTPIFLVFKGNGCSMIVFVSDVICRLIYV